MRNDLQQLRNLELWKEGMALRLHLGCGERRFDGYVNIDYPPDRHSVMRVAADYFADIRHLAFPDQSVDEIRIHHAFEHFNRVDALALLVRWHGWLKLGGQLYIETPDLIGSARVLLSDVSWNIKTGTVRHLAGDQADAWGYHVDHWFPERFEHTLKRMGFGEVRTETTSWPHPPYLCNVHAIGLKTENIATEQLLAAADELLWESAVAPAEAPTHAVWTQQLRKALQASGSETDEQLPCAAEVSVTPAVSTDRWTLPKLDPLSISTLPIGKR
jgi:hypothetical protein